MMALSLDGKSCSKVHLGPSQSYTFAGWWTDDLGVKLREFVFSGPSEDCETRPTDASALLIRSAFCVVEKTAETYVVNATYTGAPNTDANKQKKPWLTNVGVGAAFNTGKSSSVSKFKFKRVDDQEVTLDLRYATALGLELKHLMSPETHPRYFPELRNDSDEEQENIEPENKRKRNEPLDLTRVKKEIKKKNNRPIDVIDLT